MIEGWPEVLDQCIEDARNKEFVRGEHDCCMWTADVVTTLTGIDYMADVRGTYHTTIGAMRLIHQQSIESRIDAVLSRVTHPCRGDVTLIPTSITQQSMEGVGICLGRMIALIGDSGLEFIPLEDATIFWSIRNG